MEKMKLETLEMSGFYADKLGGVIPEVVTEIRDENGKLKKAVDFEKLKALLTDSKEIVEPGEEHYEFTWVGKKEAMMEANKPIRKTLRPCVEESKDWDNTENLYIEGDNLEVLKLLQESYLNSIKMIYIDPPYNTGNDFIYNDDFKMTNEEYREESGEVDREGNRLFKNTDSNGRFHSDWCSMMYSRLMLAKNLLTEDGVIFISIDDNEQTNIKNICNEIYSEYNKIGEFVVIRSEGGGMAKQVVKGHDYLFAYAKNINKFVPLGRPKDIRGKVIEKNGEQYWIQEDWLRKEFGKYGNCHYEEILSCKGQEKLDEINIGLEKGKYVLIPKANGMNIVGKLRNINEDSSKFYSIMKHLSADGVKDLKAINMNKVFDYPKPVSLIREIISGATFFSKNSEDIILDFFSGSATTASAVIELNAKDQGNRRYIMVQYPEINCDKTNAYKAGYKNICEIGKERIRRAGDKIKEENEGKAEIENLDIGFRVLKVDDSNMKDVYFNPEDYDQTRMGILESNIKEDRTELDLLFGCLIDWGLPLNKKYEFKKVCDNEIHIYNEGDLIACFDERVTEDTVKEIAKMEPLRVVFRDSSFSTSADKINVEEIFKLLSPDTSVRVI